MISFIILFFSLIGVLVLLGKINNEVDWGSRGANVLDGLIRLYCRRFHRLGTQRINFPENKRFILAPNHISGIDPFILIAASNRPIRFMIAVEEYNKPVLNWMFKAAGCIPVDRSGRVEKAFRSALRAIKNGEIVALFAQGGIHSEATPRKIIKPGIIRLSQLTHSDLLPIQITGVGAPGTVFASVVKPSQIKINQHSLVSYKKIAQPEIKLSLSQWLLGNIDKIEA
ncbi:lysophospholipid acyltransferase family protein [Aliikangiella sp. IMCC44632]